jgi:4-hydroxybenzoate polyprenyltransferase
LSESFGGALRRLPAPVRLLRPQQWAKNLFVFAPLLFSSRFSDFYSVTMATVAFVVFCVCASSVYILNDLLDEEADRAHPIKSVKRPIASGQVSRKLAMQLLATLALVVLVSLIAWPTLLAPVASYLIINVLYNMGLRAVPVVDLCVISLGFVSRIWAGAAIISVPLTSWIVIDTFFLALYLASMKRRNEVRLLLATSRKSIHGYSSKLIDAIALIAALGALVGYAFFAIQVRQELAFTIPLVALGIWRFKALSDSLKDAESPTEALVRDWPMLAISAAWGIACWFVLSRN